MTLTIEQLASVRDDWDGEGAARPSHDAICRGADVLRWAADRRVNGLDVSSDASGGVSIILGSGVGKSVWIACMNNGNDTAVWNEGAAVRGSMMIDAADRDCLDKLLPFLESG